MSSAVLLIKAKLLHKFLSATASKQKNQEQFAEIYSAIRIKMENDTNSNHLLGISLQAEF